MGTFAPACRQRLGPRCAVMSRRMVIGAASAVAAVAVVAVAAVLATRDGDDVTTAPTTTSTAGSRPSTTATTRSTTAPTTASTPTTRTTTEPTTTSTAPVATTQPPPGGAAGPGCINGWIVPTPGTALRVEPLDIIRGQMGITGKFQVIEMRYFTGPEVPWILAPRRPVVERWYVKAQLVDDPAFRARWLVERRSPVVKGIAAAAPFDTAGYQSPDWQGFIGERPPHAVEGLPGTWVGMDYDFLVGDDPYLEKPGLPDEVVHCLDGT
jgi:hypothetical protein